MPPQPGPLPPQGQGHPPQGPGPAYPQQMPLQQGHASQGPKQPDPILGVIRGAMGNVRRVTVVVGLVLSFLMLLLPWIGDFKDGVKTSLNGLAIIKSFSYQYDNSAPLSGGWNARVWLTVIVLLAYLIMAVIAMVADQLVSRTYEIILSVMAGVVLLLMIWGVINASGQDVPGYEGSRPGAWLFLVVVLLTAAAQIWQLVLSVRGTSGTAGYGQPGFPADPPQGQSGQPPAQQQPWNPAPGPNGPYPDN